MPARSILVGNRVYNADIDRGALPHHLVCQNLPWASVRHIGLGYSDVFGNNLLTNWDRP